MRARIAKRTLTRIVRELGTYGIPKEAIFPLADYDPSCEGWETQGGAKCLPVVIGIFLSEADAQGYLDTLTTNAFPYETMIYTREPQSFCDLYYYEILAKVFGFDAFSRRDAFGRILPLYGVYGKRNRWGAHFDRKRIGAQRYNAAMASVSRAVRRLDARALVIPWLLQNIFEYQERFTTKTFSVSPGMGLRLTQQGVEVAEVLTVNTITHQKDINHYEDMQDDIWAEEHARSPRQD